MQYRRKPLRRARAGRSYLGLGLAIVIIGTLGAFGAYQLPAVRDRLEPRLIALEEQIRAATGPTQPAALPTISAALPTPEIATQPPLATATLLPEQPTLTPAPTATPAPTLEPPPPSADIRGTRWEPQLFNNCGPATLTAALVYWGWRGSEQDSLNWYGDGVDIRWQRDVAGVVRPGGRDKNVSATELAAFATERAGLQAVIRHGGDLDTLKRLVAAGFPVIIETQFLEDEHQQTGDGWEGHYRLITGYDDAEGSFLTQDSFKGNNYRRAYDLIERDWLAFNYLYLVVFSPEREAEVMAALGPDADPTANLERALARAQTETQTLEGQRALFAWHNAGVSLVRLGRLDEAAAAFDQARTGIGLPWRMLWYQHDMYAAYVEAGRHQEVIDLATALLTDPGLEESYLWRGRARAALGDRDGALADLQAALDQHPGWAVAREQLAAWGETP